MSDPTLRAIALLLAGVFAWASVAKLVRWARWWSALQAYDLPRSLRIVAAPAVPLTELAVSVLLIAGITRVGAAASLSLLASFSGAVLFAHARRGDRLPCGCFGRATDRDYRVMLVRNALLALLAAALLITANDFRPVEGWSAPSGADVVPALLVAGGVVVIGWTLWQARTLFDPKDKK